MWNSKSCPDGLPRQKNGAMASRQALASTNAREIGFLSKGPLAYFNFSRDAACRVFCRGKLRSTGGVGAGQSNSIALENSRRINRAGNHSEGGVEVVCNQVEQTAGNWADTKDGVSICLPVFAEYVSCG
jgi:hypothetical protein